MIKIVLFSDDWIWRMLDVFSVGQEMFRIIEIGSYINGLREVSNTCIVNDESYLLFCIYFRSQQSLAKGERRTPHR